MSEGRFQVAAGAIIEHKTDGNILLLQCSERKHIGAGAWEFPIGRLHQFESLEDGLKREVKEETGIDDIEIVALINAFAFMRGEYAAENEVRGIVYWCTTIQRQVTVCDEHTGYDWFDIDEAIEKVDSKGIKLDLQKFKNIREKFSA